MNVVCHARTGSATSHRREPILGLLEELDADVEPLKPIHWTVGTTFCQHSQPYT